MSFNRRLWGLIHFHSEHNFKLDQPNLVKNLLSLIIAEPSVNSRSIQRGMPKDRLNPGQGHGKARHLDSPSMPKHMRMGKMTRQIRLLGPFVKDPAHVALIQFKNSTTLIRILGQVGCKLGNNGRRNRHEPHRDGFDFPSTRILLGVPFECYQLDITSAVIDIVNIV